ncbi:hypothetical protein B0H19DRAFT_1077194 [Mycena capillaripes]|nr:hypothetical protein B0H19DRAFT_1077194 [Mycena capillaripes]
MAARIFYGDMQVIMLPYEILAVCRSRKGSLSAAPAQLPFRRLEGGSPIAAAQDIHEHPIVLGVGDAHARSMLLGVAEAVAQRANSAPPLNAFANPIALNGGARDHGRRRRHLLLDHRKASERVAGWSVPPAYQGNGCSSCDLILTQVTELKKLNFLHKLL